MSIFFTGCSATYGDDLTLYERENHSWPALIGTDFNTNIKNTAVSGGTNDIIINDTVINAQYHDLTIIAWTGMDRFTREDSSNWINVNFNHHLKQDFYNKTDYFTSYGKYHYLYWNSLMFNFKNWITNVVLIQQYLKSHNKEYYMLSATENYFKLFTSPKNKFINELGKIIDITNFSDDHILSKFDEIQIILHQIDYTRFLSPAEFHMHLLIKKYPTGETNHLLVEGHKKIAEVVLDFINKGKKL